MFFFFFPGRGEFSISMFRHYVSLGEAKQERIAIASISAFEVCIHCWNKLKNQSSLLLIFVTFLVFFLFSIIGLDFFSCLTSLARMSVPLPWWHFLPTFGRIFINHGLRFLLLTRWNILHLNCLWPTVLALNFTLEFLASTSLIYNLSSPLLNKLFFPSFRGLLPGSFSDLLVFVLFEISPYLAEDLASSPLHAPFPFSLLFYSHEFYNLAMFTWFLQGQKSSWPVSKSE